ncbi:MAG: type II secretion system protein GspG [Candidatus Eremiobacteraeota bacterium]|nr:type II secretion system protein GspG [Candidatus Eremiobacteraeota bacterium]
MKTLVSAALVTACCLVVLSAGNLQASEQKGPCLYSQASPTDRQTLEKVEAYFLQQKAQAQAKACLSNLKSLSTALDMYQSDHGGKYPAGLEALVPRYLTRMPQCWACWKDTYSATYKVTQGGRGFSYCCGGTYHQVIGLGPNLPAYDSVKGLAPAKIPEVQCTDPDVLNHPLVKQFQQQQRQ